MSDTNIKTAKHVTEGGHWYDQIANQIEGVPYAKSNKAKAGQLKKPTIADARKLDLAPGVTTIIRMADKPALLRWMMDQAILAAATEPRVEGESDEAWLSRVHTTREEKSREAREEGTRIHAAIQAHFQGQPVDDTYRPHIDGVLRVLADLDGDWLIDFKGKDGDLEALQRQRTYDEHAMQLAATLSALSNCGISTEGVWRSEVPCISQYGYGTKADLVRITNQFSHVRTGIVFVSRDHPGTAHIVEVDDAARIRGWAMFTHLLQYWQSKNSYRPTWARRTDA